MKTEPFLEECLVWDYEEGGYDTHHVYGFAVGNKVTREGITSRNGINLLDFEEYISHYVEQIREVTST